MTIHVHVTDDDIVLGEPCDAERCPVAHALARATGDARAEVYGTFCRVLGRRLDLPVPAWVFVSRYDDGNPVGPLTFELDIPEEAAS